MVAVRDQAVALPPELLGAGPLDLAIEVTHHKEEGAAWGSYVQASGLRAAEAL